MATGRRAALTNDSNIPSQNDPGRELFEACRNGDLNKVKKLVSSSNVNAKDTAGRKSTPLHFAAGLFLFILLQVCFYYLMPFSLKLLLRVVIYMSPEIYL